MQHRSLELVEEGNEYHVANRIATLEILKVQNKTTAIPRRFTDTIVIIWSWHIRLIEVTQTHNVEYLLSHPKFRAAYDFLLLRATTGETNLEFIANWWTNYQNSKDDSDKQKLILELPKPKTKKSKRRRRVKPQKAEVTV
jgi:poly(A) polymerase